MLGGKELNPIIRLEESKDYEAVEKLTREAFWNLYKPGCDEHYLVHTMREHSDFVPELSFVAELDNKVIGSIIYTKSHVINEKGEWVDTITFGPLCVHPKYQRKGTGTALINRTKQIVVQKGYPAIIILGDPHNYCKHGFKTGKDYGISTIDGKYPLGLLVLELKEGFFKNNKWRFKESPVYDLDQEKVGVFDNTLPAKKKTKRYSQELFSILIRAYIE